MRLAKRENDETIKLEKIETIKNLENSQLILMERGDKIKKQLKSGKARSSFGNKNLFSVKSINSAISEASKKESKKRNISGTWCCVCVENWTSNANGICHECQI